MTSTPGEGETRDSSGRQPSSAAFDPARAVALAVDEGVVIFDHTGRVVEANPAALQLLDLEAHDLIGRHVVEVPALAPLHQPLRQEFAIRDVRDDEAETRRRVRLQVERQHRGVIQTEAVLAGAPSLQGPIVVVALRPVDDPVPTGRGEAFVDALQSALDDAVCAVDDAGRISSLNAAAERLLGVSAEAQRGGSLHELIHRRRDGSAMPLDECPIERVLREGTTRHGEDVVTTSRGQRIPVSYRCAPILRDGSVAGAVLALHDLSDERAERERWRKARVRARRERRVAAQAKRETRRVAGLEEAKTRFLSIASHELRSPLTVLGGYLSMIDSGVFGELSPELRRVLPLLSGKVAQMNGLVDAMLETARLEDGRLELVRRERDLRDTLTAAVQSVEGLCGPEHAVRVEFPPEPVLVNIDFNRVQLIIGNLLSNAIKYSPDGGEVRCSCRIVGGRARIEVRDRGVGIAAEDMDRLFTRFGRIVTPRTGSIPGTGLGLYLSRQLARMHDGDLTVASEPGRGSTFTLTLPLAAS